MPKQFFETSEKLNFAAHSSGLKFTDILEGLNFRLANLSSIFCTSTSTTLNFAVSDFDGVFLIYKVLVDFIENYAVGDVFVVSTLVNGVIDFIENWFMGDVF